MDPIELLGPNKDVMEFFTKYMMTGVKNLNTKERATYNDFLRLLSMPKYVVDASKINMDDLMNVHKPGAIIRRRPD